tara:strand:- start:3063 stop:3623 length:561 start_codon:yes stop_codon:yes gene_type:complete
MAKGIKQRKTNCKRIVIYGPESTGKTTLACDLANHYKTSWTPEYARDYLQRKWDLYKEKCNLEDLINIALGQIKEENKMISKSNKFIFCDTNVLVTKVWSETYFNGYCPLQIKNILKSVRYDYYLLTNIDVPWVKDDLRDRPDNREEMFNYFKNQLDINKIQYSVVSGDKQERLKRAILILDKIFD